MPKILAVHASDAIPVLESFRSKLEAGPISFLNVQDSPNIEDLRSRFRVSSRDTDICLIFSSPQLAEILQPLVLSRGRDSFLLYDPRTITIQLNLSGQTQGVLGLWRELFHAKQAYPVDPLLQLLLQGRQSGTPSGPLLEEMQILVSKQDVRRALEEERMRVEEERRLRSAQEALEEERRRVEEEHVGGEEEQAQKREDEYRQAPGPIGMGPPLEGPVLGDSLKSRFRFPTFFKHVDPRIVELLFATNRVPVRPAKDSLGLDFSGDRAKAFSFGSCRIRIPDDHKIGHLELPKKATWWRFRFRDEKIEEKRHFVIKTIKTFDQRKFCEIIKRDKSHTALMFVHGFNTSFKESVLRFSQIIWDMQFRSIPVLFSWPSAGGILNYLYDLNSALDSRLWFANLVRMLRAEAKVDTLHIIAHSMGNFIVLDALSELAKVGPVPGLSEIVMAAPDVDIDLYKTLVANIRPRVRGMTLYASANDKALVASRSAAGKPRAGDVFNGEPILIPNIESIDVSAIGAEMFGLNHNTFASNRSLIDDIGRLVFSGVRPPHQRSPQIRCVPEGSALPDYWRYVP